MNILKNIKTKFQGILDEYIIFSSKAKQVTLKQKTVLLLCQKAVSKVEQLKSLQPDAEEGLVATIEHQKVRVKIKFTPEKITLNEDSIEGELRLLNEPEFKTESFIYRSLIAGWKIFLGGKLPNNALPDNVKIDKDKIYYTLSRQQLQLLDILFSSLENGSAIMTQLKQGELTLNSSVHFDGNSLNIQNLVKILNAKDLDS